MAKFIYKDEKEVLLHVTEKDPYLGGRIRLADNGNIAYLDRIAFRFNPNDVKILGTFEYLTFYEI